MLPCYKCKIEKLNLLISLENEKAEKEKIMKLLNISKDIIKSNISIEKSKESFRKEKNYLKEIKLIRKYFELYFSPVCVCDEVGNLLIYNKMFSNEFLKENPRSGNILDIVFEIKEFFEEVSKGGIKEKRFDITREGKEGRKIFNVKANLIRIDGIKRVIIFFDDITEERTIQEKYCHAQKMEAIGRLAGGIAHDFNNILGVIMGYSTFILENVDEKFPFREDLQEIVKAAERASHLTKHILSFSKKQTLDKKIIKVCDFLKSIEKIIKRIVGENIEIVFELKTAHDEILMNDTELEQIIFNLIINSKDAMPNGGRIIISVYDSKIDKKDYLTLSVEDNGVGMDEETKKKIFEPFFTTKENGKGTGLGLSTVFSIVKKYNGKITFDSKLGIGTKFMIHIPKLTENEKSDIICKEQLCNIYEKGNGQKILLVDDDLDLLKINKRFLQENGYNVFVASRLSETREIIKNNRIDVVIIDLVLPDGNAVDFIKEVSKDCVDIEFIVTSGYFDYENQKMIKDLTCMFLPKPYSARDIFRSIHSVIMRKEKIKNEKTRIK